MRTLLPIFVPIVLILLRSVGELPGRPLGEGGLLGVVVFLGQPAVALLVGVGFALLLPRRLERGMLSTGGWTGEAIAGAATIIVITGAGGGFGKVLQDSGIGEVVSGGMSGWEGIGVLLPLFIAAGLKTAQGSSTVAIVTTAGIVAPMLEGLGLEGAHGRALTAVAIGAGAMMVSHANDSYFWVVTQFTGLTTGQGYRLQTVGTLVQGLTAGGVVGVLAWWVG